MSQFILSAFADEIDANLDTQMDVLDQHGIKFIEMRGVDGKNLVHYSLDEVREIKRRIDARGFKLSAVGSPLGKIGINDDFEPHLELFKHTLEVAKIMESPFIRMFSFWIPQGDAPETYRNEVIHRWGQFVKAAEGSGVILLHENEKDIYGDTPERCLDLLKSLNTDSVKGIFDFANFVQCNAKNYPEGFEMLKDHIAYIHVKDAVYSDHHVVPAGDGDGCIEEILSELYRSGYEGFLSLEPHLGKFKGFADLEPHSPGFNLPEGGPKSFAIAVQALKRILHKIEN
ncbi:sugar phosphate isomerase/epimerase family protein [Paenibacillus qinlingensis]|uniref:Sugar phosphate isomerase/epimerase n=1 Tax=Paenibacillus qinlingensis TaxID=1837343 RepID=A0ABU1NTX4_9BACL|nr:sugar phosphate isomerase/epimerase family protein [Paenibacillus qinlingensis]MDR6550929.1 sugar phosphate isomerase/epimerase [Paenibacillus qinlingensis]